MGAPATQGRLCTKLEEMQIGDYIRCTYTADTANVAGIFSNLGGTDLAMVELPTTPADTADGFFYFLKADRGLLIADRMIQRCISYTELNVKGYVTGSYIFNKGAIRILSRDEWIKYLINSDFMGKITRADNRIWKSEVITGTTYKGVSINKGGYISTNDMVKVSAELNQDIKDKNIITQFSLKLPVDFSSRSIVPCGPYDNMYDYRGNVILSFIASATQCISNASSSYMNPVNPSFRPVLEYIDNPRSKNIYY